MMSNPNHILISTLGQTPYTVTEVIGELERRGITLAEVHTLQTKESSPVPGEVQAVKPHLTWYAVEIPHVDILTPAGAMSAQTTICQTIYHLKRRGGVAALHLDLTGGRKTMSAYLMFAAQLFCDDRDFLWHVSASPAFTASKQWYPQKEGDVNLLQIPFIQLDILVKSIQEHVNPHLDIANPALVIEKSVDMLEGLALLGLMARGIDHEANNDLNDLKHRLKRIQRQLPSDSPLMREVEHIQADVHNLKGMIGSFLSVGDAGRVSAEFRVIPLRPMVTEVLAALSEIYDLYDVQLDGPDFEIQGEAVLLKRLFRIVLTNAKQHARCRQVRIHFAHNEKEGTVTIADDGIGMSPAQVDEAFALFKSKAHGTEPHPGSSSGKRVGLVVARRIARLHGGDLQLQSQPGEGTAVIFRCPLTHHLLGGTRESQTHFDYR